MIIKHILEIRRDQSETSCTKHCDCTEDCHGFTLYHPGDCHHFHDCSFSWTPLTDGDSPLTEGDSPLTEGDSYTKTDAVTTTECGETTLATEGAIGWPEGSTLATEEITEESGGTTLEPSGTIEWSGGAIPPTEETTEESEGTTLVAVETITESSEGTTLTEGNGWVGRKLRLISSNEILVIKWLTLLIQASLVTCCYACLFYRY